jgi:hypothetical protein
MQSATLMTVLALLVPHVVLRLRWRHNMLMSSAVSSESDARVVTVITTGKLEVIHYFLVSGFTCRGNAARQPVL